MGPEGVCTRSQAITTGEMMMDTTRLKKCIQGDRDRRREAVLLEEIDEEEPLLKVVNDRDCLISLVSDCMKDARRNVGDVAKCRIEYWADRIRILAEAPGEEISVEEQATVKDCWQFQPGVHTTEHNKFWTRMGLALHEANAEQAAAIKAAFAGDWAKAMENE